MSVFLSVSSANETLHKWLSGSEYTVGLFEYLCLGLADTCISTSCVPQASNLKSDLVQKILNYTSMNNCVLQETFNEHCSEWDIAFRCFYSMHTYEKNDKCCACNSIFNGKQIWLNTVDRQHVVMWTTFWFNINTTYYVHNDYVADDSDFSDTFHWYLWPPSTLTFFIHAIWGYTGPNITKTSLHWYARTFNEWS